MNAVEIEEAVSELASKPFDRAEFAYQFLAAFGNKATTIKRLRAAGGSNASDVAGGILQRNNIHLATCAAGEVAATLKALRDSPKTVSAKAKFILATDGETLAAEDTASDDPPIACEYAKFPDHFGYFLPLAGITTVKQIRESSFDIRATGRLNKLYVELLKDNPEWATAERRPDMNHFMARLIFCFFAEDTDIFNGTGLFTATTDQMSERDSSNTHDVISEMFRAMNTKIAERADAKLPRWADVFPYVNGGLFSGSTEVPRFSKIARSYLINIGSLDWKKINPDIFGSMIQAVADDEERGALGMHYTSVPNILKVLNPLFLDDLRALLEEAGDNGRKLLNLRNRMAKIRVFDPACGSGNFLVIAYKEIRAIESVINQRRDEEERRSDIPLTNFRGIELRDFPAEIARLALIIAEYQCDVTYRGQKEALAELLPLNAQNWITCGNALRLDWLSICPPTGKGVKMHGDDLFNTPLDQAQIDFENEGGETYICGNPPYAGKGKKSDTVSSDMTHVMNSLTGSSGYIDLAGCWFVRASQYLKFTKGAAAFVATNSICQGQQIPQLWPLVLSNGLEIIFAHRSFKWANLATHNAGVICVIVAIAQNPQMTKRIYDSDLELEVKNITPYLLAGDTIYVERRSLSLSSDLSEMLTGSVINDGGYMLMNYQKKQKLHESGLDSKYVTQYLSSQDFIRGQLRFVLTIPDEALSECRQIPEIDQRLNKVSELRSLSTKQETREGLASIPHRFQHHAQPHSKWAIIVPRVSSESRPFLPVGVIGSKAIIADTAFELIDAPLWNFSILASKLHIVWVGTVCGKLKTDFRYSNSLGWNTFPVLTLTEKNRADLTRCAEDILLAREAHFPATIADLYDPEDMPDDLRRAHEANDEVLERIYIGRRFKNDTERLEKLFELYTKMTQNAGKPPKQNRKEAA
jgi:hypothetical protein